MKIDDYTKVSHKRYSNITATSDNKKIKYLKKLITRTLLSIILVLSISIFIKIDKDNALLIDEYMFQDSLEFTKINNWYQNNIGSLIPELNNNETTLVFSSDDLKKSNYITYLDGIKFDIKKNSPISLFCGGIVVFIGEKDGYGNTLILQGNDGIDYWYGGITNLNVNLYDYLEKDTLIGETGDNYLYLILQKDGKFISYDEYIK